MPEPSAWSDDRTPLRVLRDAVEGFANQRDWGPFHAPKNLAMALSVEAAELMENFLWVTSEESRRVVHEDAAKRQAVADELADCLSLILQFGVQTGIDLAGALQAKMARNAVKYPAPA